MASWTTLRTAFYSIVGDSASSNIFFTDTMVENFANRALRDLAQKARYKDTEYTGTAPAESTSASIPGVLNVWRAEAEISGVSQALSPTTKTRIIAEYPGYQGITSTIRHYYTDMLRATSAAVVGLFPSPSTDTDVRFYCHGLPDEVDDDSAGDDVDIPNWAVSAVLFHMLYQAYRVDTKLMNLGLSAFYKGLYWEVSEALCVRVNDKLKSLYGHHRPPHGTDVWARSPYYVTGTV